MEPHRDIYKAPDKDRANSNDKPSADKSHEAFTNRSRKQSIIFTITMAGLLIFVIWFALEQERRSERPEFEDLVIGDVSISTNVPLIPLREEGPTLEIPDVLSFMDDIDKQGPDSMKMMDPDKVERAMGQIRLANDFARNKGWAQAEERLLSALKEWPDMNIALRLLGVVYTQLGQFDRAIAALERSLKIDPFIAETYSNLSAAYMHRGRMDKAEDLLHTALRIDPNHLATNLNLGLLYLATGRFKSAADYLERSVGRVPQNVQVRNNLAVALLRTGRYEESREHLEELMKFSPETAYAYFNMAITYALVRDFDSAMVWIEKGAEFCSPIAFYQFVSDSDFNELRADPEFQALLQSIYGDVPAMPDT